MFDAFVKRVQVTFIEDATGEVLGISKMALADLPDSFLESTTLEVGEKTWAVKAADPPFKRLFAKSKKLTLRLNPVEMTAPQELLYSLPSIADDLARSEGAVADGSETVLLQDDWRQVECVSRRLGTEILQQIGEIEAIYDTARQGIGFSDIHVRRRISDPLKGSSLSLARLEECFGPASEALRFQGSGRRISAGFCYDIGGDRVLYGSAAEGRPKVLGVAPAADIYRPPAPHLRDTLSTLCQVHDLFLVDWCRCLKAEPGSVEFAAIFSPFEE